jgi:hypothetical protein
VDRLAALGNSLVPQIAEWIGRRIMSFAEVGVDAVAVSDESKPKSPAGADLSEEEVA